MDRSKSCLFLSLKYILIAFLLIDLINLIVIIPTAIAEESQSKTPPPDSNPPANYTETEKNTTKRRIATLAANGSTIFFLVLGLVGVSRENFYISSFTAVFMTIGTIAAALLWSTPSSILTVIFGCIVTVTAYVYAFMCRVIQRDSVQDNQIVPVSVSNLKAAASIDSGNEPDSTETATSRTVYLTAPDL